MNSIIIYANVIIRVHECISLSRSLVTPCRLYALYFDYILTGFEIRRKRLNIYTFALSFVLPEMK